MVSLCQFQLNFIYLLCLCWGILQFKLYLQMYVVYECVYRNVQIDNKYFLFIIKLKIFHLTFFQHLFFIIDNCNYRSHVSLETYDFPPRKPHSYALNTATYLSQDPTTWLIVFGPLKRAVGHIEQWGCC